MFLKDRENMLECWKPFFTQEIINELNYIESKIGSNINPSRENVLRFTDCEISNLKVVILAQDPYPAAPKEIESEMVYVATGRSFEVGNMKSWTQPFAQHSLKNIVRMAYKTQYGELLDYQEIKNKISGNEFAISSPNEWFSRLESQGVLFLNTYLTCEIGKPNSHRNMWGDFSHELIAYIAQQNTNLHWFLWGGESQKLEEFIYSGVIHKANHPRLYSSYRKNDFLRSTCFEDTKQIINWCC